MAAQQAISVAAKKYGKAWGRPVGSAADAVVIQQLGAQLIVLGSPFWAIQRHLKECGAQFDELTREEGTLVRDEITD
jgi:hypothetical protein